MNPISSFAAAAHAALNKNAPVLYSATAAHQTFKIITTEDSVFIRFNKKNGCIGFRVAFIPGGRFTVSAIERNGAQISFRVSSAMAKWNIKIEFPSADQPILH